MHEIPRYLDEKEVATITKRALQTLRNDRHRGQGIPYRKCGKSVRYRLDEVLNWMEQHRVETK